MDETIADRYQYRTFDEIIQDTLRPCDRPCDRAWPGPHFTPGTKQEYNSLGFRIGGELIERITGHSFKQEVTRRILQPLRLEQTSVPEGAPTMPLPYLHGYMANSQGSPWTSANRAATPQT
ncbi:serine hydrolase [Catenulispora yoronensis]